MIFPFLDRFLVRYVLFPRMTLRREGLQQLWQNGYAWGFAEGVLCSVAVALVALVLVLAIRSRRRPSQP